MSKTVFSPDILKAKTERKTQDIMGISVTQSTNLVSAHAD